MDEDYASLAYDGAPLLHVTFALAGLFCFFKDDNVQSGNKVNLLTLFNLICR